MSLDNNLGYFNIYFLTIGNRRLEICFNGYRSTSIVDFHRRLSNRNLRNLTSSTIDLRRTKRAK